MVTVKRLKPYYVKTEEAYIRIILAYQYFSVEINNKDYQFIPVEANEIRINRETKQVENKEAIFAFQRENDIVNVPMSKLLSIPNFLQQLHTLAEKYYIQPEKRHITEREVAYRDVLATLEKDNLNRLIDKALDDRDEAAFKELVKLI